MQLIVTDAWLARSRVIHLTGTNLVLAGLAVSILLLVSSLGLYHWVFLKGAREGWPIVGPVIKLIVRDEFAQRDRFMRENLDAMARRVGELQAKLIQLESLGERVSGLAGISPAEIRKTPSQGGALVSDRSLSMAELQLILVQLDQTAGQREDWLSVIETSLFEQRIRKLMIPTQHPVADGSMGSPFGWRIDPLSGQSALHTGLDFQADRGTAILAAAGGVVVVQEYHPAYGNLVEIDHGNDIRTLYAHSSQVFVKIGDLIKRGQKIAEVGSTGRSTGAHLHFEVLVQGVPQDPRKFLSSGGNVVVSQASSVDVRSQATARPARR